MLNKTKQYINKVSIKKKFKCKINNVHVNTENKYVQVRTSLGDFITKKLFISHGSRLSEIHIDLKKLNIIEKIHRRPAVHIILNDNMKSKILEGIFIEDELIKYVHDISRFTDEAENLSFNNIKIFVFALQHNIKNHVGLKYKLLKKIQHIGMVNNNANILNYHWSDIILPLYDNDLKLIKRRVKSIQPLCNFCRALDYILKSGKNLYSSK